MRSAVSVRAEAATLQALGFEIELSRTRLDDLSLPSGQLVVCDPLSMPETEPFRDALPEGTFPIYATIARLRDGAALAWVTIEFEDIDPDRFGLLSVPGETIDWAPDHRPGFVVDTGLVALMDVSAADALVDLERHDDMEEFEKQIESKWRKRRKVNRLPFANEQLSAKTNAIVLPIDHGSYSAYVGFVEDRPVQVLIDFRALDLKISPSGIAL